MPIFENSCGTPGCDSQGKVFEWYARNCDVPEPDCEQCGNATQRQVSRFGVIWTGPITGRYLDRSIEGGNAQEGGHWAWKRKTLSGKPEPVYIESFSDQRRYCREEGLGLPQDTGAGRISGDGRTFIPISNSEAKDMREANGRAIIAEKKEKADAAA